jgi:hypothetical protein
MGHNYRQNGDLVPDPDMEIRILPEPGMAEALSYQDSFGYRRVYFDNAKVDAGLAGMSAIAIDTRLDS